MRSEPSVRSRIAGRARPNQSHAADERQHLQRGIRVVQSSGIDPPVRRQGFSDARRCGRSSTGPERRAARLRGAGAATALLRAQALP